MASTPARTVRTVRLTIAFVVTLAVVLMTLRIGNSYSALRARSGEMKQYLSRQTAKLAVQPLTEGRKFGVSPAFVGYRLRCWRFTSLKSEYYLDNEGRATLVQTATGLFERSCQQEGPQSEKVRAILKKTVARHAA
jgi:hypothetical protein